MTAVSPVTTTADTAKQPTEYVVLCAGDAATWREEAKRVTAANADAAIKKVAGENVGVYVAIPTRSWQPRTLKVETQKRIQLT